MKTEIKQELHSDNLATKGDLREVKNELQSEIQLFKSELQSEIQEVRLEIANTKNELIKWVLGIGITAIIVNCSAMFTMLKLLAH